MKRPNIIYIHSHDTGRYLQPYGYPVPTPNLVRLAQEGSFFRNAYSTSPTCSPSRASLLTGMYPHNNGMLGLAHRGFSLNDYGQHLIHTLKKAGYRCVLVGVQHIASGEEAWKKIGYDDCLEVVSGHTFAGRWEDNSVHERASEFLANNPAEPFFLSVGFTETHRAFPLAESEEQSDLVLPPAPLPDTPETRQDMAGFMVSAGYLDQKIGVVLEALKNNQLHGPPFPKMKGNLTGHGTGVALIMRGPQDFWHGKVYDQLISQIDIFPTLCELLEIDPPSWLQGRSLMPLLTGQADQIRDEIFTEMTFHAAYEPARAIRTPRWNYIRRFDGRIKPVLPNIDDGPSKDVLIKHGLADQEPEEEALYDLIFDPVETNNLIDHPKFQEIAREMRSRLSDWMHATNDPLLAGPLTAPPGAYLDDPNALSPT
jgi:N-sulfoglucosamine sulfohydrolase